MFDKKNILGIEITDASKKDILEYIIKGLEDRDEKWYIVTINPEILMLAYDNEEYKKILNNAKLALADGVGVVWASKILGKPLKERTAGVDLLQNICKGVAEKPITVGFLGGKGGVAEKTAECLREKYPGLKVAFVGQEWPNDNLDDRGLKVDILFVAFGAPKQEIWISENLDKIPVRVAMGVGGAFDYISGKVPRAPLFIQKLGLEWLYRLIRQPWRWKRQLSLLKFIFLVIKQKIWLNNA